VTSLIDRIADAIAHEEGFYLKGPSLAKRNLNPGNIRQWMHGGKAYPTYRGYVDFGAWAKGDATDGLAEGWRVLKALVGQYVAGKYTGGRVPTLYQMFEVYAPAADANHPKGYAEFVAKSIGVPADQALQPDLPETT
jgi:hypothetical protein